MYQLPTSHSQRRDTKTSLATSADKGNISCASLKLCNIELAPGNSGLLRATSPLSKRSRLGPETFSTSSAYKQALYYIV